MNIFPLYSTEPLSQWDKAKTLIFFEKRANDIPQLQKIETLRQLNFIDPEKNCIFLENNDDRLQWNLSPRSSFNPEKYWTFHSLEDTPISDELKKVISKINLIRQAIHFLENPNHIYFFQDSLHYLFFLDKEATQLDFEKLCVSLLCKSDKDFLNIISYYKNKGLQFIDRAYELQMDIKLKDTINHMATKIKQQLSQNPHLRFAAYLQIPESKQARYYLATYFTSFEREKLSFSLMSQNSQEVLL